MTLSKKIFKNIPNWWLHSELARIESHFKRQGYYVIKTKDNSRASINRHLGDSNIIAWGFAGHGYEGGLVMTDQSNVYYGSDAVNAISHKLAQVILFSCEAAHRTALEEKYNRSGWKDIISKYGSISMSTMTIRAGSDWEDLPVVKPE